MPFFVIPFPQIDPVLIEFGPFAIRWYALAYIAGLVIGIALIDTLLFSRSAEHADRIKDLMTADPQAAARLLRIAADELRPLIEPMLGEN